MRYYLTSVCRRRWVAPGLLLAAAWSLGCSPYQIEGLVVPGGRSEVLVLDEHDQRLTAEGIAGATVALTVDPSSIDPRPIAQVVTDGEGRFVIPIDEFGAGLLEYQVAVCCRVRGYERAYQVLQMPSRRRRLLIVMAAGRDRHGQRMDILRETQDLADDLLNK